MGNIIIHKIRKKIYKLIRCIHSYLPKIRGYLLFGIKDIQIDNHVVIPYPETVFFKGSCVIKSYCRLESSLSQKIILGRNTMICSYTTIETAGGTIILGDNIIVGEYSTIQGQGDVILEDNVLLASHVHFISNDHTYTDIDIPIKYQPNVSKKIIVKQDTWIGINVTVLSGVTIGKHCIIGSGSIVKNDVPDYSVAVGSPAKVVKKYNFEKNQWIQIKDV